MSFLPFDCGSSKDIAFVGYQNDKNKKNVISVLGSRFQDTGMTIPEVWILLFVCSSLKWDVTTNIARNYRLALL